MTGGFLTDKQASYGWFFKLSEWANFSSYDVGIRSGSSASHILFEQVGIVNNTGYDEIGDSLAAASRGLSGDSLKKLPHHMILKDTKAENTCCTICLQDIVVGEIARSLPHCRHTFHLICVDKWLVKNDSCPICRQNV